jgi:hypothetical protein
MVYTMINNLYYGSELDYKHIFYSQYYDINKKEIIAIYENDKKHIHNEYLTGDLDRQLEKITNILE